MSVPPHEHKNCPPQRLKSFQMGRREAQDADFCVRTDERGNYKCIAFGFAFCLQKEILSCRLQNKHRKLCRGRITVMGYSVWAKQQLRSDSSNKGITASTTHFCCLLSTSNLHDTSGNAVNLLQFLITSVLYLLSRYVLGQNPSATTDLGH